MSLDIVMDAFSLSDRVKIARVNRSVLDQVPVLNVEGGTSFFAAGTTANTLRLCFGRSILIQ